MIRPYLSQVQATSMVISMFVRITWEKPVPSASELRTLRRIPPGARRGYDLAPIRDFDKMTKGLFDRQG